MNVTTPLVLVWCKILMQIYIKIKLTVEVRRCVARFGFQSQVNLGLEQVRQVAGALFHYCSLHLVTNTGLLWEYMNICF